MRRAVWAGAVLALVGVVVGGSPAAAAPTTEVVQGEYLRLVSVADWESANRMLPGASARWDVTVSADAPEPGTVAIELSADGDLSLEADVRVCASPWRGERCPGGADVVHRDLTLPLDDRAEIMTISDTDVAHVRLDVTPSESDGVTQVRVHAIGSGEEIGVGPPGELPPTGMPPFLPWLLSLGAVLVGAGAAALGVRRRRAAASAVTAREMSQ